jgi:hypothetical protein
MLSGAEASSFLSSFPSSFLSSFPVSFGVRALATWRMTHLLVAEDGPADLVVRARRAAGSGLLGQAMDCFYCASVWVALPMTVGLSRRSNDASAADDTRWPGCRTFEGVATWLALSGAACLLEQVTRTDDPSPPLGDVAAETNTASVPVPPPRLVVARWAS